MQVWDAEQALTVPNTVPSAAQAAMPLPTHRDSPGRQTGNLQAPKASQMLPLAQGLCSEHWAHTPLARLQSIPLGVQSLSESQAARQTFCTHRRAVPQSASVLHSTHLPAGSQTLPCPQPTAPPSLSAWQVAGLVHRLERQACPVGQSLARAHCTHRPRLESQIKSVEAQSRLSLHPCGFTHAPPLQLRPEGQSVSALQVSLGTLMVPPVLPPLPELPAGPVIEPPVLEPPSPPEALPPELSPALLLLELPALLLLEPPLEVWALEPPELAEEEFPPSPPESPLDRLGLAAQAAPTRAMVQTTMKN